MQRLNIPLSRHKKTTRRHRWVVWLLICGWMVVGVCTFQLGAFWYGRSTILQMAPANTVIALQLHINPRTIDYLSSWLEGVPLISHRSFELNDLLPYVEGEMALFVANSGDRSVAIRSTKDIPTQLFTSYGIHSQQKGDHLLLASHLSDLSGIEGSLRRPILPKWGQVWLGRLYLPEDELIGSVYQSTNQSLLVDFKQKNQITSNVHSIVSDPSILLRNTWITDEIHRPFDQQLLTLLPSDVGEGSIFSVSAQPVDIVVRSVDNRIESLFFAQNKEFNQDILIRDLQILGAFARPTLITTTLQDGTSMQEFEVRPEHISVEQTSTTLGTEFRVTTGAGSFIIAAPYQSGLVISNSEDLLSEFVGKSLDESTSLCSSNHNIIGLNFLLSQIHTQSHNSTFAFYNSLFHKFSNVSLEINKYSTQIRLCR